MIFVFFFSLKQSRDFLGIDQILEDIFLVSVLFFLTVLSNYLISIEVWLIYNVMLISGVQHLKMIQLLQNMEYSFSCDTVEPCNLSVLHIVACIVNPSLLIYPSPSPVMTAFVSMSVSLFMFCKKVHLYLFF